MDGGMSQDCGCVNGCEWVLILAFRRHPGAAKMMPPTRREAQGSDHAVVAAEEGFREFGHHPAMSGNRAMPLVLGRLPSGTVWQAMRVPPQVSFSL
jgi:hypothetical protein